MRILSLGLESKEVIPTWCCHVGHVERPSLRTPSETRTEPQSRTSLEEWLLSNVEPKAHETALLQ